jgi:DNA-binding MarR family transcriptional regulator
MNDSNNELYFCAIISLMKKRDNKNGHLNGEGTSQIAFLLAQIGAHAASMYAERAERIGLSPSHTGIMRLLARSEGLSQRELCGILSMLPSRLVVLLDELQEKGIIERRDDPADRRSYALHLSSKGKSLLDSVSKIAQEHNEAMCAGLDTAEREALAKLLARIAKQQDLTPGVHPGYKWLGRGKRKKI